LGIVLLQTNELPDAVSTHPEMLGVNAITSRVIYEFERSIEKKPRGPKMIREEIPLKVRVSLGSAILLNLIKGELDAAPTTIYLLTYHQEKCTANCSFCSQARSSASRADMLSRVTWPTFSSVNVLKGIENSGEGLIRRVCIQTMNYAGMFGEVLGLVRRIHHRTGIPISVSSQPLTPQQIEELKEAGIDRIGIPLDAPTERLFENVKGSAAKGPYRWRNHLNALKSAVQILGRGRVTTHFIVGLGESDEELLSMVQRVVAMGVYPALFAFTPIEGTKLEGRRQPEVERYRRIQTGHYLITKGKAGVEDIVFDSKGFIRSFNVERGLLVEAVEGGIPFMTCGCPDCNRPYYNERVGGPLYNIPRTLRAKEIAEIKTLIFGDG